MQALFWLSEPTHERLTAITPGTFFLLALFLTPVPLRLPEGKAERLVAEKTNI